MLSQPLPIATDAFVGRTFSAVNSTVPAPPTGKPENPEFVRPICRLTASPRIGVVPGAGKLTGAPSCSVPAPSLYSPMEEVNGVLIVRVEPVPTRIVLGACVPLPVETTVKPPGPVSV